MSVYKHEDGTTVIELGLGTTAVGMVYPETGNAAVGISFSQMGENLQSVGDRTIIHICNASGIVSYMKAIIDLATTWEITGDDPGKISEVKKQMDLLHKTLHSMG
ncbi:hypothetical protein ACFVS2_20855 [Brevibacillus sp. NPDC058079]|uniref:hypothetical protein n=1 Tax=Brevibacillus sp. NPDC058079 TaxID=3346330 RepID=UPI0036EBE6FB